MNCSQVEERIEAWVDGDLAPPEARRLEAHLQEHRACAERAELARRLREALREMPERDAPPALVARIKAAARRSPAGEGEVIEGPWRRLRRPLALLAASLALAVGGLWNAPRPAVENEPPAEVAAATEDLRRALTVVAALSRRAGRAVQRDVLEPAVPALEGLEQAVEALRRLSPGAEAPPAA